MPKYYLEYRIVGYTIADCMRPDPNWGKRSFYIDTDLVECEDESELKAAARATAPDGYELLRMTKI